MDNGNNGTPTRLPQEFMCPDGYISTRVPLKSISFLNVLDLRRRIHAGGPDYVRYSHYAEIIADGAYANGVPVVYRTPRGNLIASDIRYSDLVIYAEQNVPGDALRNPVHPMMPVRIIDVASRDDIAVQRALWVERHNG